MGEFLETLLNMSISGAIISVVIILLRIPLRKAPRRYSYLLWSILGIRLLCPFSLPSPASLFNLFSNGTDSGRVKLTISGNIGTAISQPITGNIVHPSEVSQAAVQTGVNVTVILFWVWAAGAAVFAVWTAVSFLVLRRRIHSAVHLRDNIWECGNIDTAFVMGIIRPRIYLPTGLSERDRDFIIAHEKTHIRRLDFIVKPIALLALCIHWFDPFVWVSFFLMVRDMEISCDELAVKNFDAESRKEYAVALLNMSVRQNRLSFGGVLAFGESSIKQRIKSVLSPKKPTLWITIAAVAVIAVSAVCLLTSPGKTRENTPDNAPDSTESQPQESSDNTPAVTTAPQPESEPEPETVSQPEPAPVLNEDNAAETVNSLLNSARLISGSDGSLSVSFAMPDTVPSDPDEKTKLYLTLNVTYYLGEGTYQVERFLDDDPTLQPGETWNRTVLSADDEREFQSVMFRAAFMTEVGENTFREYYAEYIELDEPNAQVDPLAPADTDIGASTVVYHFSGDDWTVTFGALPEGITLSDTDPDAEHIHSPGIPEIYLLKDGKSVGTLMMYSFGTTQPEDLAAVDTSSDEMPMQIFSPIGLSSMVDYSSNYAVVYSTETGAADVSTPVSADGTESQCVLVYDYTQAPYFAMFSLEPDTLSEEQLVQFARSVSITGG